MIYETPRYLNSGDQYLTVEIGDEMTLEANFKVIAFDRAIKQAGIESVIETFPGWRSMLVHYNSLDIPTNVLIEKIKRVVEGIPEVRETPSRLIGRLPRVPWHRVAGKGQQGSSNFRSNMVGNMRPILILLPKKTTCQAKKLYGFILKPSIGLEWLVLPPVHPN